MTSDEREFLAGYDPSDPIDLNYQKKIGDEPAGLEKPGNDMVFMACMLSATGAAGQGVLLGNEGA